MEASLPKEAIAQLKVFIHLVKSKPELLQTPDLKFFKDFIESFGGKVPEVQTAPKSTNKPSGEPQAEFKPEPAAEEPESEESDIELDNSGVVGECSIFMVNLSVNYWVNIEHIQNTVERR